MYPRVRTLNDYSIVSRTATHLRRRSFASGPFAQIQLSTILPLSRMGADRGGTE